jgi:hypothetical protein
MAVVDPALVAAIADALTRGQYPGFGAAQNDSTEHDDNVDATHPLNIKYFVPGNSQRVIAARLSFSLGAYRTYDKSAAAGLHVHYWTVPSATDVPAYYFTQTSAGTVGTQAMRQVGGGGTPGAAGYQTSTEMWSSIIGTQSSTATSFEAFDTTGHTHAQVLGVTEGVTATGVSVAFDGVDKTSALGGPFNADQVEMDVLPYIQQKADKTWHTIALTPSGNGRIYAKLRLSLFVNAGIKAVRCDRSNFRLPLQGG